MSCCCFVLFFITAPEFLFQISWKRPQPRKSEPRVTICQRASSSQQRKRRQHRWAAIESPRGTFTKTIVSSSLKDIFFCKYLLFCAWIKNCWASNNFLMMLNKQLPCVLSERTTFVKCEMLRKARHGMLLEVRQTVQLQQVGWWFNSNFCPNVNIIDSENIRAETRNCAQRLVMSRFKWILGS